MKYSQDFDDKCKGNIFDIKRFATQDGPGIRTLIFLKGCPLRCKWCSNPESQISLQQIMYYKNKCTGCGNCIRECPENAIYSDERFGLLIDKEKCTLCGKCVDVCYYGARELMGKIMSVADVMDTVSRDICHYDNTGGGVTIGGGEPLFQPEFCLELTKACRNKNIDTAIETSGYAKWEKIQPLLPYLDLIFYDIKQIDSLEHREQTGVSNDIILENLERINARFTQGELVVRIPYIPGVNSDETTQENIFKFVSGLNNVSRIEILPYHRFGMQKYEGLGLEYEFKDLEPINKNEIAHLINLGNTHGVNVQIGTD